MSLDINSLSRIFKAIVITVTAYAFTGVLRAQTQTSEVKGAPKEAQEAVPATKLSPEDGCSKLFQKYVLPLQELWKKRPPELRPENTNGYALIEDLTPEHCSESESRNELINLLAKILNSHSGKIGVVLSTSKRPETKHILAAFEAHLRSLGMDPKKTLIVVDGHDKEDKTTQAIASLIFEHKVTAIIGGQESREADMLRFWGSKLLVPTFIMNEPPKTPPVAFVYYTNPTQKSLAKSAVDANLRFGHKRVAILNPSDQHSDEFVEAYAEVAKSSGITVTHKISYDPKRFDLMEAAAKKIFRLDGSERQDELKKLYEAAKQNAKETGVKFNPKMVALQPDVQQDAVLIPDNFRIVRHFAKIFVFLGVRKLPLFGHYEWRSIGLVNPWDAFLSGSYFVDFQGSYASMPADLKIQTTDSPFFVAPDKIEQADYSALGWRAITGPIILSQKRSETRRKLDRQIPRKAASNSDIFFDRENTLAWPSYLFKVSGTGKAGNITLVGP